MKNNNFFITFIIFFFFKINLYANPINVDVNQIIQKQIEILKSSQNLSKKDLESLGLDNLEKNESKESSEKNKSKITEDPNKKTDDDKKITKEKKTADDKKINNIENESGNIEKSDSGNAKININNLKRKIDESKFKNNPKAIKKKNSKKNKSNNSLKAIDLEDELNNEMEKKKLEIENQIKLEDQAKLKEKEDRYIKLKKTYLPDEEIEDEKYSVKKIIPVEKNLSPFTVNELPPLPVLSRTRAVDNYHIPFIYTPKEYIDSMFASISIGSVSYFNEAFKYVQNPNVVNDQGETALTHAIFLKKYSILASLLAKGADPNMPNGLGHMPISIAIEMLDFVSLEILIKNFADIKYKDAFGRNYLMHASRVGFLPAVDLLVKSGINVNEMDNDGFTALSIAYRHKKELIVQYLLKNGAKTWIEKNYNPEKKYFINDLNNRWSQ